MKSIVVDNWYEANQRYLSAAVAIVSQRLEQHIERLQGHSEGDTPESDPQQALQEASVAMPAPPALETLCRAFGFSPFERDIVLLCAGVELNSRFASLCAAAQNAPARPYPTFSLALAVLPDAHWSALPSDAPLRRWRLIEVGPGTPITLSPLHIDERILHYLTGTQLLDERLFGIVEPLEIAGELVPSHRILAEHLVVLWSQAGDAMPVVQLCGNETAAKQIIAVAACKSMALNAYRLSAYALPTDPAELDALIRLWKREAILNGNALLLDCDDMDLADAARLNAVTQLVERMNGALIVSSRERRLRLQRPAVTFEVRKPTVSEQQAIWSNVLGEGAHTLNGRVEGLVAQFNLNPVAIQSSVTEALMGMNRDEKNEDLARIIWDACRAQARVHLDDLAQRIDCVASWDDLVLPEQQMQTLREIAVHVKQRATVYETWGFAAKSRRGLGISALFTGPSGTGKTMAAEVLANQLRLDLYHIDLSSVVSKYIGETEKNLRRIFDAAEAGGAVLLFDEADALFGKRSEVKDSHDRYANIEVSYLLQRMEAYLGLAILTTNMKNALDTAFLRRIHFIVQFPFPDAAQRAEIWRRIFPAATPIQDLDIARLSRLNVAGGNIRNIAMNAAFLAADAGEPVQMKHLLRATRSEYAKLEKPLSGAEIGDWS